ncbi:MAG: complex I subunit 1 family protein [Candidatus Omnitrophota bacterium]
MKHVLYFLIFPGFLFTTVLGLFVSWFDRKVTARVQWRVGPPLLQPVYDIVKLLGKEIILPNEASFWTYFLLPIFGLAAAILASTIVWLALFLSPYGFIGDIIVIMYLLTVPAAALILASFSTANPLASVGASREMKMVLSYELPFILACLVPIIKANTIRLSALVEYQAASGQVIGSISGTLAFIVALLCTQAKLGLVPFDAAEAETEIMGGAYIEFSGAVLAVFKLTKFIMLVAAPLFLALLFMGSAIVDISSFIGILLKYLLVAVLITLIRNTNPRVKIDQAMRFFWGPMSVIGIAAVVLAILGF